jgi:hypothetical protein
MGWGGLETGQVSQARTLPTNAPPPEGLRQRFEQIRQSIVAGLELAARIEDAIEVPGPTTGAVAKLQGGNGTITALSFEIQESMINLLQRLQVIANKL